MGWVEIRYTKDGSPRYVAKYRDIRGRKQTAGTFDAEKPAITAWQDAEAKVREGRGGVLVRGRRKFGPYVRETWFPNHRLELRSRESYDYLLDKHIIPWFGSMAMIEILPSDVREFVIKLENNGVKASTVRYCLTILSAIFTTALNDQLVYLHPCKGVRGPTVAKRVRQIMTPEQFDVLYEELADEMWRLLVETGIESGLRWGELAELRPKDFDFGTRRIMVRRSVVELTAKFHPMGGRFLVKEYPKDAEHRVVSVSAQLIVKLRLFIKSRGLGDGDLIFAMPPAERKPRLTLVPDPDTLGLTEPNERGKTYRHGTMSAYSAGRCRCEYCRASYRIYRIKRRGDGKDEPRGIRAANTDGHISRNWFRLNVWLPAREAAGLGEGVKVHSLRHAHASWLLAGGADIATVKERLGHSSILTTQKYIHTLPDEEQDAALDAFEVIRNRSKRSPGTAGPRKGPGV